MKRPQGFPGPVPRREGASSEPTSVDENETEAFDSAQLLEAATAPPPADAAAPMGDQVASDTPERSLRSESPVATKADSLARESDVEADAGDTEVLDDAIISDLRRPADPSDAEASTAGEADERAIEAPPVPSVRAAQRARRRAERREMRRFTQNTRRKRRNLLIVFGAVALVGIGAVVAAYSPLFSVETIRIEGANRVDAEQVSASMGSQIGTPLALVDREYIGEILGDYPLVQSYSIEAIPPSTLVIRLVERTPVGVFATDAGFELVDAAGVVIQTSTEPIEGYPILDTDQDPKNVGFQAVAAVVRALPDALRGQVERVSAASADDVRLHLTGNATVLWGSAEESALKAVVLTALMNAVPVSDVNEYDVSAPESPVTR